MNKPEIKKTEAAKSEIIKKEKLVDIVDLDVRKIIIAFSDIKKQNAFLIDAIKQLNPHDRHFDQKVKMLHYIASNLRDLTERQLFNLERFFIDVEDHEIDQKFLEKLATVNRPSKEAVKYGQSLVQMKKSFLKMAVKSAPEPIKENKSDK